MPRRRITNIQGYGDTIIYHKARIDGDLFYVCLPVLDHFCGFWNKLNDSENLDLWNQHWHNQQAQKCLAVFRGEIGKIEFGIKPLFRNTNLNYQQFIQHMPQHKEIMLTMIPLDKTGKLYDRDALIGTPDFSSMYGGTLYLDNKPIMPVDLTEKTEFESLSIGNTVEGYELLWFSYKGVLYSAFTIKCAKSLKFMEERITGVPKTKRESGRKKAYIHNQKEMS